MSHGVGPKAGVAAALIALAGGLSAIFGDQAETQTTAPTPRPGTLEVDWGEAERDGASTGRSARPQETETVDAVTGGDAAAVELEMPLLMPTSLIEAGRAGQLDQPLKLISEKLYYSAEAKAAPRSYLIQGTRYVFDVDEVDEVGAEIDPTQASIENLEYGIEATFQKYGVVYSVSIFCADPNNDPQCSEEDTVRRLVSEMTLVK